MTIYKQPNGKFCECSLGKILRYNLSEEDIIERIINEAKEVIKKAEPYGNIIAELSKNERFVSIDNRVLRKMGFTENYQELVKYVPREPINPNYVGHEFTTYANCPNCKKIVQNGMGFKQEKCKCGQILKWD